MPLTRPGRRWTVILAVLAVITFAAVVGALGFAHVDALRAAGVGGKGSAIAGLGNFVSKIKGNITWAVITVAGLMIVVVGAMFVMGHSRAQDLAAKVGIGAAIIAAAGGIVA